MANNVIELQNVTKKFGKITAVNDVSLAVEKGTVHGFLGPNGAGKTTTIKLLMDFIRPTKGNIYLLELDARKDATKLKQRIGYLSGDFELYDNLTGKQYLRYMANLRGMKDLSRMRQLVDELETVLDRKIGTLSRGNKQKVGLVAALMHEPELLILDEPTTGLDPLMQQKFYHMIRRHVAAGHTVFMSSHILSEVQEVCDVVSFMKKGEIIETMGVQKLLAHTKRHITLLADKNATLVSPSSAVGASNIRWTKTTLEFDVSAADRKVLRWIATQPVKDVTISEANLDSVFMNLYEGDGDV